MLTQRKADLGSEEKQIFDDNVWYPDSDKPYLAPNFSVTQARKASFLLKPVQSVFLL